MVSTRGRGKSRAERGGSRGIKKGTFEQGLRGNKAACHMDVTVKFIVGGTLAPLHPSGVCKCFLIRNLCFSHDAPKQPSDLPWPLSRPTMSPTHVYILTPPCPGRLSFTASTEDAYPGDFLTLFWCLTDLDLSCNCPPMYHAPLGKFVHL